MDWVCFCFFVFGANPDTENLTKLWLSPKQPPLYTKALTWLSSWVTEVDFALHFWGVGTYHMTSLTTVGLKQMLYGTSWSCDWAGGSWHLPVGADLTSRGWNGSWIGFLWENSDFSIKHVHNHFDHRICSLLHFYSNVLSFLICKTVSFM